MARRKKDPTPDELMDAEQTHQIETMATDPAYGLRQTPEGVAFDYQVIEDENILRIFDENPWLTPIWPSFSRLNFLTHMTEKQAKQSNSRLRRKIFRLACSRKSREDKDLLDSLYDYRVNRMNDSVKGTKLTVLATNRRILQLERIQQKRGLWNR